LGLSNWASTFSGEGGQHWKEKAIEFEHYGCISSLTSCFSLILEHVDERVVVWNSNLLDGLNKVGMTENLTDKVKRRSYSF